MPKGSQILKFKNSYFFPSDYNPFVTLPFRLFQSTLRKEVLLLFLLAIFCGILFPLTPHFFHEKENVINKSIVAKEQRVFLLGMYQRIMIQVSTL